MVDNFAEKVDECPLNWGHKVFFMYNWDGENCPLYRVAGYPLFRGCLLKYIVLRGHTPFRKRGKGSGNFTVAAYCTGISFTCIVHHVILKL